MATADAFATKGIEYILVLVFLFSLFFFWRFINRAKDRPTNGVYGPDPLTVHRATLSTESKRPENRDENGRKKPDTD